MSNSPEEFNIEGIFRNKYIIPLYQRNYAWEEAQVTQLIQDIWDYACLEVTTTNYYIGTLVVHKREINNIVNTKRVQPVITIFSPSSGIISDTESMSSNTSNPMENNATTTQNLNLIEGTYIKKNETVFKLLDTNKVWALFNVLQGYNNLIYVNQPIKIFSEIDANDFTNEKVGFIETQLSSSERTNRIRVYLNNTQKYPIGLRLQGVLKSKPISGLWINKTAVVSIGSKNIVFIKIDNGFKALEIQKGLKLTVAYK